GVTWKIRSWKTGKVPFRPLFVYKSQVHVCGLDRINLIAERKIIAEQVYRHIDDIKGARATNCQILITACLRNLYCLSQDKMQYAGMIRYFVNKEQNVIGVNWATLRDMAENGDLNP
ncbi:hypothetical protein ACV1C9_15060, partial [Aeromonas caviae]